MASLCSEFPNCQREVHGSTGTVAVSSKVAVACFCALKSRWSETFGVGYGDLDCWSKRLKLRKVESARNTGNRIQASMVSGQLILCRRHDEIAFSVPDFGSFSFQ